MKRIYINVLIISMILIFALGMVKAQAWHEKINPSGPCYASMFPVLIRGFVYDLNADPLGGVKIYPKTNPSMTLAVTGKNGYYEFHIFAHTYTFVYEKEGYEDYELTATIVAGCAGGGYEINVGMASADADIGLRIYDGQEIVPIACEPAGTLTSPLRIHKEGTNYGIVLVDSSDSCASKIKIQTSSGIKSLKKFGC